MGGVGEESDADLSRRDERSGAMFRSSAAWTGEGGAESSSVVHRFWPRVFSIRKATVDVEAGVTTTGSMTIGARIGPIVL